MKTAEQIALWADKLRDLSAEGLHYARDSYDQERYRAVQDVALSMLALASDRDIESLEPLRGTIFTQFTPLIGGDAAIIDDRGRILLIQRSDNHRWAMPGGALQVGETPAEGVLREVMEETGIPCQILALVGIFDIRPSGLAGLHQVYLITFLCRPTGEGTPTAETSHSHEVLDLRWFEEDALPKDLHFSSPGRIHQAFSLWRQGETPSYFDPPERTTMRIQVRVHGLLTAALPQPDAWTRVSLPPCASVSDMIRALGDQFESPLFDPGSCTATIQGTIVGLDRILEDGDQVELYHLFSGG